MWVDELVSKGLSEWVALSLESSWWVCDSFGLRNSLGSGSGNWLAQRDETWMQRDSDRTGLPVTSPGRRQQKWLVDATWLDHVRKVWKYSVS